MALVYAMGMNKSIAIDATHFGVAEPTGVENYVQQLLPELSNALMAKGVAVSWIGHSPLPPANTPKNVQWVHSPHIPLWSQRELPKILKKLAPTLFFTPSGVPPLLYGGPSVATIHDMAAYLDPGAFSFTKRFRLTALSKQAARKAIHLFTVSEFSKAQVQRIWKLPAERITVTPLGFTPIQTTSKAVEGVGSEPFFLFLGRIERKKNLSVVIKAFARLCAESPCQLVLAGKDGFHANRIKKEVAQLPDHIQKRVIFTGYVDEAEKHWLYEHAAAVLVPCMIEGFGLPVLEAWAEDKLVICANSGSLPEVGRDAVVYAEGDIATDWYLKMQSVLRGEIPVNLQSRGNTILKEYTWKRTVDLTGEALLPLLSLE